MQVSEVLAQARARLGDEAKHRWSDDRLVYIANQGQRQICKLAGILRREAIIPLDPTLLRYRLPSDCATVRRVEYKGAYVPMYSRNDTDAVQQFSEEFIVTKNNLAMGLIDLYPDVPAFENDIVMVMGELANPTFTVVPTYGVVTNADLPYEIVDIYGELVSLDLDRSTLPLSNYYGDVKDSSLCDAPSIGYSNSEYGVVTGVSMVGSTDLYGITSGTNYRHYTTTGTYGMVTDIVTEDAYIKVFYEAVPTIKLVLGSTFVIPDVWEDAMLMYVVGTALQDDNDANNIARGEGLLAKFTNEVLKAREMASKDFSGGVKDKMQTRFRRI